MHDLHLWTLTSGMHVATAHLVTADRADRHAVLDQARDLLRERHGVAHATLRWNPPSTPAATASAGRRWSGPGRTATSSSRRSPAGLRGPGRRCNVPPLSTAPSGSLALRC